METLSKRIEKVHSGLRDIHAGHGRDRDHDATVLLAIQLLQDLQPIVQAFEKRSPDRLEGTPHLDDVIDRLEPLTEHVSVRDAIDILYSMMPYTEALQQLHPDTVRLLVNDPKALDRIVRVNRPVGAKPVKPPAKPAEPQGLQILRSRETLRGIEVNHENIHDIVLLLPGSTGKPTQALYDATRRFALLRVYIRDQLQQLVDGDWIVFEKADRDRDSYYSARVYGKGLLKDYEPVGPVEDTHGHCG